MAGHRTSWPAHLNELILYSKFLGRQRGKDRRLRPAQAKKLGRHYLEIQMAWWRMSVISPMWEAEVGGSWSQAGPGKSVRFYLRNKLKEKMTGGVAQEVNTLPSK
jgi:hypothetical protein